VRDSSGVLQLFVRRRAFYRLADVRRLLRLSAERLEQAIAEGAAEVVSDGTSMRIAWEDVAALALTHWTPRRIASLLAGAGHAGALPPLNQWRTITVELPVYQIRLLHHLAERRSTPGAPPLAASDVLEYELGALAFEEDVTAIDRVIPGFAAAANYPSLQDQPQATQGCVFCGADGGAAQDICTACRVRHVPADDAMEEVAQRRGNEGTTRGSASAGSRRR
jgi:hypothetical protein